MRPSQSIFDAQFDSENEHMTSQGKIVTKRFAQSDKQTALNHDPRLHRRLFLPIIRR
jgi:hypothetical protein